MHNRLKHIKLWAKSVEHSKLKREKSKCIKKARASSTWHHTSLARTVLFIFQRFPVLHKGLSYGATLSGKNMWVCPQPLRGGITWWISAWTEISARLAGWDFSPVSETNPREMKLAITWRFSPGWKFQPALRNRAWIFSPDKRVEKAPKSSKIFLPGWKLTWACAIILFTRKQDRCKGENVSAE